MHWVLKDREKCGAASSRLAQLHCSSVSASPSLTVTRQEPHWASVAEQSLDLSHGGTPTFWSLYLECSPSWSPSAELPGLVPASGRVLINSYLLKEWIPTQFCSSVINSGLVISPLLSITPGLSLSQLSWRKGDFLPLHKILSGSLLPGG